MYWVILLIVLIVIMAYLVWASADIGSNVYVKTLCKIPTDQKIVYLTFDDGPDEKMTPLVLDILKEYDIRATFFMIGNSVRQHPELVQRAISEGHIVANHTYTHSSYFPLSNSEKVRAEIRQCSEQIEAVTGQAPNLFRPPFGVTNPIIGKALTETNLKTIGWTIRTYDTVSRKSRESVFDLIMSKLQPGAIILMHDRCEGEDTLLRKVIPAIKEKGYAFRTIPEYLK